RALRVTPSSQDTSVSRVAGDDLMSYYPDPRFVPDYDGLMNVLGKISNNTYKNAYIEAMVLRGPAFNFVYDRGGAQIDPSKGSWPPAYWPSPQHAAIILPYEVYNGTATPTIIGPYLINLD